VVNYYSGCVKLTHTARNLTEIRRLKLVTSSECGRTTRSSRPLRNDAKTPEHVNDNTRHNRCKQHGSPPAASAARCHSRI